MHIHTWVWVTENESVSTEISCFPSLAAVFDLYLRFKCFTLICDILQGKERSDQLLNLSSFTFSFRKSKMTTTNTSTSVTLLPLKEPPSWILTPRRAMHVGIRSSCSENWLLHFTECSSSGCVYLCVFESWVDGRFSPAVNHSASVRGLRPTLQGLGFLTHFPSCPFFKANLFYLIYSGL